MLSFAEFFHRHRPKQANLRYARPRHSLEVSSLPSRTPDVPTATRARPRAFYRDDRSRRRFSVLSSSRAMPSAAGAGSQLGDQPTVRPLGHHSTTARLSSGRHQSDTRLQFGVRPATRCRRNFRRDTGSTEQLGLDIAREGCSSQRDTVAAAAKFPPDSAAVTLVSAPGSRNSRETFPDFLGAAGLMTEIHLPLVGGE